MDRAQAQCGPHGDQRPTMPVGRFHELEHQADRSSLASCQASTPSGSTRRPTRPTNPITRLKCRVSQALVRIFENESLPTGSLGSPAEVGKRLSDPTEGAVKCKVVNRLMRK
jgi:hypothetical protein